MSISSVIIESSVASLSNSQPTELSEIEASVDPSVAGRLKRFQDAALSSSILPQEEKEHDFSRGNSRSCCCDKIVSFFRATGCAIAAFFVRIYTCFKNRCCTPDSITIQNLLKGFQNLQQADSLKVPSSMKAVVVLQTIESLGISESLKAAFREARLKGMIPELTKEAIGVIEAYQFRLDPDNIKLLERAAAQGIDSEKALEEFFLVLGKQTDACRIFIELECQPYLMQQMPVYKNLGAGLALEQVKNNFHNPDTKKAIKLLITEYFRPDDSYADILNKIEDTLINKACPNNK